MAGHTFGVGVALIAHEVADVRTRLWPEAASILKQHQTHLIVTVHGEAGPVERARLLTQATAAVIASCTAPLGVYWGGAALVMSAAKATRAAASRSPSASDARS